MDDVKAITFDVGGTLIEPWPELEDYQGAQAAGMQTRWLCRNGNVSEDYTINSLVSLT